MRKNNIIIESVNEIEKTYYGMMGVRYTNTRAGYIPIRVHFIMEKNVERIIFCARFFFIFTVRQARFLTHFLKNILSYFTYLRGEKSVLRSLGGKCKLRPRIIYGQGYTTFRSDETFSLFWHCFPNVYGVKTGNPILEVHSRR